MMVAGFAAAGATAQGVPAKALDGLVFVKGGTFKNTKSNYYDKGVTISDFYIGKYLVTEKEWTAVMGSNPSKFSGDNLPVEMVNWYDAIEYCNRRSIKEGLKPYYNIDKTRKDPNNLPDPQFGRVSPGNSAPLLLPEPEASHVVVELVRSHLQRKCHGCHIA